MAVVVQSLTPIDQRRMKRRRRHCWLWPRPTSFLRSNTELRLDVDDMEFVVTLGCWCALQLLAISATSVSAELRRAQATCDPRHESANCAPIQGIELEQIHILGHRPTAEESAVLPYVSCTVHHYRAAMS
jgi:hypothetical protein